VIEYVTSPQQIVCDTRPMPVGDYSIRVVVDGMRQADYWSNFQVTACACLCALYPCPALPPVSLLRYAELGARGEPDAGGRLTQWRTWEVLGCTMGSF